ncbi:MAG: hypothetical protein LBU16_06980 [Treponema sp.]|jgi:hypothetical protein|nr:hypothetical protein [Treponema sp.]
MKRRQEGPGTELAGRIRAGVFMKIRAHPRLQRGPGFPGLRFAPAPPAAWRLRPPPIPCAAGAKRRFCQIYVNFEFFPKISLDSLVKGCIWCILINKRSKVEVVGGLSVLGFYFIVNLKSRQKHTYPFQSGMAKHWRFFSLGPNLIGGGSYEKDENRVGWLVGCLLVA